jgi:hypothetical protein
MIPKRGTKMFSRFDREKAIAVVLYLAHKKGSIDFYALLKMIYFADLNHLRQWGRTITGDSYARMDYGPTPSKVYDILKEIRQTPDGGVVVIENNNVFPGLKPDMDRFSQSEIDVIDAVFDENVGKTFSELVNKAHDEVYDNDPNRYFISVEEMAGGDASLLEFIKERFEEETLLENLR